MKYLHLILASLFRHKGRTILTLLSVCVAFLLFGLLDTVGATFGNAGQSSPGRSRLLVTPKAGMMTRQLPHGLLSQIEQIAGVAGVEYASAVIGTYQDPRNTLILEAHPAAFFDLYPEIEVPPEQVAALRRTRTGVLAGEAAAKKYGWKVGDKIPLETGMPRKDGSTVWTFDVVGMLRYSDPGMKVYEENLFGNWSYVDAARESDTGTVAYYSVKVANVADVDRVAREIDTLTANSSHETKTQSENAWATAVFQQWGDIGLIVTSIMGAVLFTLLLLTGHAMTQAVHERTAELAVLKTIGFTGRRVLGLILCESVALVLFGGVIGLVLAMAAVIAIRSTEVLPIRILPVGSEVWIRGLMLATAVGVIVGALPAVRGMRLRIVDALSGR